MSREEACAPSWLSSTGAFWSTFRLYPPTNGSCLWLTHSVLTDSEPTVAQKMCLHLLWNRWGHWGVEAVLLSPLALASLKLWMGVAWPPTCPEMELGYPITHADRSLWPRLGPSTQVWGRLTLATAFLPRTHSHKPQWQPEGGSGPSGCAWHSRGVSPNRDPSQSLRAGGSGTQTLALLRIQGRDSSLGLHKELPEKNQNHEFETPPCTHPE